MPPTDTPETAATPAARHWRANRRMVGWLLLLWFAVTFVAVYFSRDLSFRLFGWPFSFWMAAQGSLAIYVLIVWWYARRMRQIDAECGMSEDD